MLSLRRKTIPFLCIMLILLLTPVVFAAPIEEYDDDIIEVLEDHAGPVIRLQSYKIIEGTTEPSDTFTVEFTIENSNRYVDAYRILFGFVVKMDDTFYINEGDSNQFYLDYLAGGDIYTFTATLHVVDFAERPAGVISFVYYCMNEKGIDYENTQDITLPILVNPPKCEMTVEEILTPDVAYKDSETLISSLYVNTGERKVVNGKMIIKGNFKGKSKTFDLESFGKGEYGVQDCFIVFDETGMNNINISFEYEDEDGRIYKIGKKNVIIDTRENRGSDTELANTNVFNDIFDYSKSTFIIAAVIAGSIILLGIIINVFVYLIRNRR